MRIEFFPNSHIYHVDGAQVPSVTQVLKAANLSPDYSRIDPYVLRDKAQIGTRVHELTQVIDLTGEIPDCLDIYHGYLQAYRRFKDDFMFEAQEIEMMVASSNWYAGTLDRVGTICVPNRVGAGTKIMLDIKTGEDDPCSYGPQLAAYEMAYRETENKDEPIDRYVLQLNKDGQYKLIPCKDPYDASIFLCALTLYQWRLKHGR